MELVVCAGADTRFADVRGAMQAPAHVQDTFYTDMRGEMDRWSSSCIGMSSMYRERDILDIPGEIERHNVYQYVLDVPGDIR